MKLSRRHMLKVSAAGAAAACLTGIAHDHCQAAPKKIPIGLELWSVRHQCDQELPIVLKAIAEMGYDSVELAHSYYGYDAEAWKDLLDKNGLTSCGMHLGLGALEGDAFDKTVEIHKLLNTPYLIVASLPHKKLESPETIVATGKQFNDLCDRLAPHGMKIGYHCHGGDFAMVEGKTAWERFGQATKDDVLLQLDVGNCLGGNGDPIAMLKAFPGRAVTTHIKDHGGKPGAVFGEGEVDWDVIFRICETTGGVKQYVIEEEGSKGPEALADVRRAIGNFRKMGK